MLSKTQNKKVPCKRLIVTFEHDCLIDYSANVQITGTKPACSA